MKLIIIYGPPAAGKTTVAQALAKRLGYKVLDMNLTIGLVRTIFPMGTPAYSKVNSAIRLMLIEEAAKELDGLVFTYAYASANSPKLIKKILDMAKHDGFDVHFVRMIASTEILLDRVENESRKHSFKIQTKDLLTSVMSKVEFPQIPFVESLVIDSSEMTVDEACDKIIEHYGL